VSNRVKSGYKSKRPDEVFTVRYDGFLTVNIQFPITMLYDLRVARCLKGVIRIPESVVTNHVGEKVDHWVEV
jgi:hypothetical protein